MENWTGVFQILIVIFALRTIIWLKLLRLTSEAGKLADLGQNLINTHGNTVGQLKKAGVYEHLDRLEAESGKLYRKAVPLAAILCWWPVLHWIKKPMMLKAYDKVGYFTGKAGSYDAWEDIKRAYAKDTEYYFPKHMKGLLASLRTATPLF